MSYDVAKSCGACQTSSHRIRAAQREIFEQQNYYRSRRVSSILEAAAANFPCSLLLLRVGEQPDFFLVGAAAQRVKTNVLSGLSLPHSTGELNHVK